MDQIDYAILDILKHNARETASNISKEVHLSVSSVMNRIRQMEDSGIIQGYEVKVDSKKLMILIIIAKFQSMITIAMMLKRMVNQKLYILVILI